MINSFVSRHRRLTKAQQYALTHYSEKHGVPPCLEPIDLKQLFERRAPLVVDVGVGTGESTWQHARLHPENNYLAIEVHRPGISQLLNQIEHYQLTNVKVINDDVINVFSRRLPAQSISQLFVFFPDPWPKKRHHKRRLINNQFLALVKKVLAQHGRLYIATDWQDYAESILGLFAADQDFINLAGHNHFATRPAWRTDTHYERRGMELAHGLWDFCYALR